MLERKQKLNHRNKKTEDIKTRSVSKDIRKKNVFLLISNKAAKVMIFVHLYSGINITLTY